MVTVQRLLSICLFLLLASCGGGGGGGGGGPNPPDESQPSLTLQNEDAPAEKKAVQVIDVSNLPLTKEIYEATLDGEAFVVARGLQGQLMFLLPPGLEAGMHELTITIDGERHSLNFESAADQIAPRAESLAGLEAIFYDLVAAADQQILQLQADGVDQAVIDDLIAKRDLLDPTRPEFQTLTDQELDYLHNFFAFSLAPPATSGLMFARNWDVCTSNMQYYTYTVIDMALWLGAAVFVTEASLMFNPILGLVVGAGAGLAIANQLSQTLDALRHLVKHCISPTFNYLTEELLHIRHVPSSLAARSTIINTDDTEREFEHGTPRAYRLKTEFELFDEIRGLLPDAKSIIDKLGFLIPDSTEEYLLARLDEDYTEPLPVDQIILEQISNPAIKGNLEPLGEDSFTLTFRHSSGSAIETEFNFVLYDTKNDIKTRYTARLWSDGHCPPYNEATANVVATTERCIILTKLGDDQVYYEEYRHQSVELREIYIIGDTPWLDLKSQKDLENHDSIPSLMVDRLSSREDYVLHEDGVHFYSVLAEVRRIYDDESQHVKIYSEPLQFVDEEDGYYWQSVLRETHDYYPDDSFGWDIIDKVLFSEPIRTRSGQWQSVPKHAESFDSEENLIRETKYSEPMEAPAPHDYWSSAPIESWVMWIDHSGENEILRSYHPPRFTADGEELQSLEKSRKDFINGDIIVERSFSEPLQEPNGSWQVVLTEAYTHDSSGFSRHTVYSLPQQDSNGDWQSTVLEVLSYESDDLTHQKIYSAPLQAGDGSWQSVLESEWRWNGEDLSGEVIYSEPLLADDGNWQSVLQSTWGWWGWSAGEQSESIYSKPLQAGDGNWQSVLESTKSWTADEVTAESFFSSPVRLSNGSWDSAVSHSWSLWRERREEQHMSDPLEGIDTYSNLPYATSTTKIFRQYARDGALVEESLFSEPYLEAPGQWEAYTVRTNWPTEGCYKTFNKAGDVLTDTCN